MTKPAGTPTSASRLLASGRLSPPLSLREHLAQVSELNTAHWERPENLIEAVERSGLRGRGGAGFPTGTKMRAVARAGSRRPVVVANGVEGEPASEKDDLLVSSAPHLVLDGVAVAAWAVGAREANICIGREAGRAVDAITRALAERKGAGIDPVDPRLVEVPDGYVAGEESAIVNHLNGGPGKPTFVPPRPFERGVAGRPTLVSNVETLANLALIARRGPRWFQELGTADDPGTVLITITGAVASPGVYEIAGGTPLAVVLEAAGGITVPVPAFLLGGYGGSWVAADAALRLPLGHAALRTARSNLGPGVIVALPQTSCGVVESARVARYLADQSAGQCGPCVYGLEAIADALEGISDRRAEPGAYRWIERWCADIGHRGACSHPDGAIRFIASSLRTFADEVDRHEQGQPCCADPDSTGLLPVTGSGRLEIGHR